jgi:hypothetical protein
MSNFTVTLEVKFAPELMLVLNSLIAASQPKTSAIQAPVNFNTPAPTQPAIKGLENCGPVPGQNPTAPRPSAPQQYAPAPQYAAPVAPQAPQYTAPVQQAPVNPTRAMPANNMASPVKTVPLNNAPIANPAYPSNPAPINPTYAPMRGTPVNPAAVQPIAPTYPNAANTATPAAPATTYAAPTATPGNVAPTAATPAYQLADLQNAAGSLLDIGKGADVRNLLDQFHTDRMDHLPVEQYGAFATALRQMGARI